MEAVKINPILIEYKAKKEIHEEYCMKIKGLIIKILRQKKINCHSIESRVKQENSLALKIENSGEKYSALSDITDISGLRIITYFSTDVDRIASIIQEEFEVDKSNSVDKRIKLDPDRFGYLSIHYVVKLNTNRLLLPEFLRFKKLKIEIQIRSILQHAWAEIEHDLGYKSKHSIPRVVRRDFSRLAGLLEIADEEFVKIRAHLEEYNENIKGEIKATPSNVLIDKVTIVELLNDNDNIASLIDYEICKIGKAVRMHPDESVFDNDVERIKYLGFNTINEILNSLNQNKKTIIRLAHRFFKEKEDNYLRAGLSLFYLAYATLGTKGNIDDITDYLNEFHIGETRDRENLAEDIIRVSQLTIAN